MKQIHMLSGQLLSVALSLVAVGLAPTASAQLAAGKTKFFGNVVGGSVPGSFSTYWNQITPENAGKWGSVEGTRNVMNWGGLDTCYNYATSHGYKFKQHCFVWGAQYTSWITSLYNTDAQHEVKQLMQLYASRYPNTWAADVVNEPIKTANPWASKLGGAGSTGWDWVIWSYQQARQFLPNKVLLINEYGTENDSNARTQYKNLINLLKTRGLIDGIGIQSHYFNLDNMTGSQMTTCLNDYATLGLPLYCSELDITGGGTESGQSAKYQDLFPAMYNHSSVQGITAWGYIEGQTWRSGTGLVRSDGSEKPAMTWLKSFFGGSSGGTGVNVWLEAERGTVGSLWQKPADSTASNSAYCTIAAGNNSTTSAPTSSTGWIQLPFSVSSSGTFSLWFRTECPDANGDSFWVRMDNGSWVTWNSIPASSSWRWDKFTSTYSLSAGSHTLYVAYREDGAKLDKIYLTTTTTTPSGTGGTANN